MTKTEALRRALVALEWFVDNDDTIIGQDGNEFWENGLSRGITVIREIKEILSLSEIAVDPVTGLITGRKWKKHEPEQKLSQYGSPELQALIINRATEKEKISRAITTEIISARKLARLEQGEPCGLNESCVDTGICVLNGLYVPRAKPCGNK